MSQDEWSFGEEPWWDAEYRAIKFVAETAGGKRYTCAISDTALNDYFQTEDTREAALANYREHLDMVHSLAVRLIREDIQNDQGVFLITSKTCRKYWS